MRRIEGEPSLKNEDLEVRKRRLVCACVCVEQVKYGRELDIVKQEIITAIQLSKIGGPPSKWSKTHKRFKCNMGAHTHTHTHTMRWQTVYAYNEMTSAISRCL